MSILEIIGFITGVLGVWLTTKENIWCWPVAIVNVALYTFIFYDAHLYADMGLQIFYFGMSFYGWYYWLMGGKQTEKAQVSVSTTKYNHLIYYTLITIIATVTLGYCLKNYTDAALPYVDSFCTSASLVGQFLQARKKLENWIIWILVDALYIGIYIQKELYLTALLYTIFVALAVVGYQAWKKSLKLQL